MKLSFLTIPLLLTAACYGDVCVEFFDGNCPTGEGSAGAGAQGGTGGTGADGGGAAGGGGNNGGGGQGAGGTGADGGAGAGGNPPCADGCMDPTPLCNEDTDMCVACLSDDDCPMPGAARCNAGTCVPCSTSGNCEHLADTQVCSSGTCVQCALGAEGACSAGPTCDLLAKTCTGPGLGMVTNCKACSNDLQCGVNHRCIEMDFEGSAHGYYCLKDSTAGCARPFSVSINQQSISGESATNYCGIDEDAATCEAVLALLDGWVCSGTNGFCSDGIAAEVPVPGALCKQVGALPNQCTYECGVTNQCPNTINCGGAAPTWCGGM